jgi:hypothetical protein
MPTAAGIYTGRQDADLRADRSADESSASYRLTDCSPSGSRSGLAAPASLHVFSIRSCAGNGAFGACAGRLHVKSGGRHAGGAASRRAVHL